MSLHLKLFNTTAEYNAYTADTSNFILPNVSYCKDNDGVHYNPIVSEQSLVVTYNVESEDELIQLYMYNGEMSIDGDAMFDKVEIDGVVISIEELDNEEGKRQLSIGEHTIKYTLKDPTFIGVEIESGALTRIGACFAQCPITSVNIPSGVTSIGMNAFFYCSDLTSIEIPNSVTSIGSNAFGSCTNLTSINIPDSITTIGDHTFFGCTSLTSIDIPSGVTSIDEGVFYGCSGLTSIDIPSGVTSIGDAAFQSCSGLTSIDIPSGVTSIGMQAFIDCSSLTSITSNAPTTPTLGERAFNYTNDCPIYVPSQSVEAYKAAANWNTYESRIQAIQ